MTVSKHMRRLAIAMIAVSATGCKSGGGLASINLNPFIQTADAGATDIDPTEKVAMQTAAKTNQSDDDTSNPVTSFFGRTRDALAGVVRFGDRSSEITTTEGTPESDPLRLANKATSLGPEVYVANGQLWESSGSFDRARDNYEKALEADPENGPALGAMARMHERQDNLTEAIQYFDRAIEVDANDPSLYNDLGLVYSRQKSYDQAVDQIQKAIAIAPGNKRFANNLATVYMDAGKQSEALSTLESAHSPAVAKYNMAYLHFKRQQLPEARDQLQLALQIDPTLEPARNLLDKVGGTQVAQLTSDTIKAAGGAAGYVQDATKTANNVYQALSGNSYPTPVNRTSVQQTASTDNAPMQTAPGHNVSIGQTQGVAPSNPAQTSPRAPVKPDASPSVTPPPSVETSVPSVESPSPAIQTPPSVQTPPAIQTPPAETSGSGDGSWSLPPSLGS